MKEHRDQKEIDSLVRANVNRVLDEFWTAISNTEKNTRYARLSRGRIYPDEYEEALGIILKRFNKERALVLWDGLDPQITQNKFNKVKREGANKIREHIRKTKLGEQRDRGDYTLNVISRILEDCMRWEYQTRTT